MIYIITIFTTLMFGWKNYELLRAKERLFAAYDLLNSGHRIMSELPVVFNGNSIARTSWLNAVRVFFVRDKA